MGGDGTEDSVTSGMVTMVFVKLNKEKHMDEWGWMLELNM